MVDMQESIAIYKLKTGMCTGELGGINYQDSEHGSNLSITLH